MRQGQQNRRGRGRNRKGQNPLSRNFESNGPDVKIRGNAAHIAEKYMSLARDAAASGDSVQAENYLQHAEHYNRIIMAAQAQMQQPMEGGMGGQQQRPRLPGEFSHADDDEYGDGDEQSGFGGGEYGQGYPQQREQRDFNGHRNEGEGRRHRDGGQQRHGRHSDYQRHSQPGMEDQPDLGESGQSGPDDEGRPMRQESRQQHGRRPEGEGGYRHNRRRGRPGNGGHGEHRGGANGARHEEVSPESMPKDDSEDTPSVA